MANNYIEYISIHSWMCLRDIYTAHSYYKTSIHVPMFTYFDEMIKVMRWEINSRMIFFVSSTALTWDARIRITECIYTENYHCS